MKFSIRRKYIVGFIILIIGIGAFLYARVQYVVPIIMYHSINPQPNPAIRALIVSPQSFERQMRFLKNNHYNVIPLESIVALIEEKKKVPLKTIAITFDDGYKDNYTYAFPVLKKYGLPATIFIIIEEVGRPQSDRLSWDEIKVMQDSGIITFGSHTMGPEPLVNIKSDAELKRQIFNSKKILEAKLGKKVLAFSYPGGMFNDHIRQLVIDAGYKLAVATKSRKGFSNEDIFALKRLRISPASDNLFVFWIETSGFYNFIKRNRNK